jgi:hypothetical protein
MIDGQLSPEEHAAIDAWNEHGAEMTENNIKHFLASWFTNIRALLQANFPLKPLILLAQELSDKRYFVLLGSGPSAPDILESLPSDPSIAVICGATCIGSMLVAGRKPNAIMVADSNPDVYTAIKELDPEGVSEWKIALPVTCDPSWYAEDSIFRKDQLYFYMPFLDYFGSKNLAYNDILVALFPDVHTYIAQAGSVGNSMLGLADMACGESSSKRIFLGIDCCGWLTDPPRLRAPTAVKYLDGKYRPFINDRQKNQNTIESEDSLIIHHPICDLQTNIVSLGYAVQMLYIMHLSTRDIDRMNRYIMLAESSKLFVSLAEGIMIPIAHAYEIGIPLDPLASEDWHYATMQKLIDASNKHIAYLKEKEIEEAR